MGSTILPWICVDRHSAAGSNECVCSPLDPWVFAGAVHGSGSVIFRLDSPSPQPASDLASNLTVGSNDMVEFPWDGVGFSRSVKMEMLFDLRHWMHTRDRIYSGLLLITILISTHSTELHYRYKFGDTLRGSTPPFFGLGA